MLFKKLCAEKLALCEEIVSAFSVLQEDFPVEIVNVNDTGFLIIFKDFPSEENSFSLGDNFFTTEPEALLARLYYEYRLFLSIEYSRLNVDHGICLWLGY